MPELPEVETIKRQLQKVLPAQKIKAVFVYKDKMVKLGDGKIANIKKGSPRLSRRFAALLKGKKIITLQRRAKYLIIKLSQNYFLLIHLRMSGQLIFVTKKTLKNKIRLSLAKNALPEALPGKHTHVEIVFSSGDKLFYNDPRQFGHLRLVNQEQYQKVFGQLQFGPEPLALSYKKFRALVKAYPNKRAKDFLLAQSIIAGIGNIYSDEALFIAKISPLRKIGSLKEPQLRKLLLAIKKVLLRAIKLGGSSIAHFLMTNGKAGKFSSEHLVYGKAGKPCPVCKRPLLARKISSRTSTFCKHCQK